jgi:hypothetical protein
VGQFVLCNRVNVGLIMRSAKADLRRCLGPRPRGFHLRGRPTRNKIMTSWQIYILVAMQHPFR